MPSAGRPAARILEDKNLTRVEKTTNKSHRWLWKESNMLCSEEMDQKGTAEETNRTRVADIYSFVEPLIRILSVENGRTGEKQRLLHQYNVTGVYTIVMTARVCDI